MCRPRVSRWSFLPKIRSSMLVAHPMPPSAPDPTHPGSPPSSCSSTPDGGLSDARCKRRFSWLEVFGVGHAVGEGDGEHVEGGLPACHPSCLPGAFGV